MIVTVLAGSPKGEVSVTMQSVQYLLRRYPEVDFRIHQAAQRIRKLESDPAALGDILEDVSASELVLFAFPLYYMAACSQYLRFLELVESRDATGAFRGRYAGSLTTSIHFFDHTAHELIRAVAEDWGMRFVDSHPAHMNDLQSDSGRNALEQWFTRIRAAAEQKQTLPRRFSERPPNSPAYQPGLEPARKIDTAKRIVVVADGVNPNLETMVRRFAGNFAEGLVDLIDLREVKVARGCQGCLKCGPKNVCAYAEKDELVSTWTERVMTADGVVFAQSIVGRWMSPRWKAFLDRSFFRTHQRVLPDIPIAFLVAGNLRANPALREALTAYAEWQNAPIVDFVTDEISDKGEATAAIDSRIDSLALRMANALEVEALRPISFLGHAGMKVFRDDVFSGLRVIFRADHRAYKRGGVYDFPQRHPIRMLVMRVGYLATGIPFISRGMMKNLRPFMIRPFRRALALAEARAGAAGGVDDLRD